MAENGGKWPENVPHFILFFLLKQHLNTQKMYTYLFKSGKPQNSPSNSRTEVTKNICPLSSLFYVWQKIT